jgi:hypothetical protein
MSIPIKVKDIRPPNWDTAYEADRHSDQIALQRGSHDQTLPPCGIAASLPARL